ncbi:hypothetical protein [Sphingobacterium sp. E70]|nr:hypothetical protein [Sphingobacterium sp. E70]
MEHQHLFEEQADGAVLMRDVFNFRAPWVLWGGLPNGLSLHSI